MTSIVEQLTYDEIAEMSYERLEKLVLHHIVDAQIADMTELLRDLDITVTPTRGHDTSAGRTPSKWEVVLEGLFLNRLIVSNRVSGNTDQIRITQEGYSSFDPDELESLAVAASCISHDILHENLQHSRLCFLEGEYNKAALEAIRTVEMRVRSIVPVHKRKLPTGKLLDYAFSKYGKLADAKDKTKSRVMRDLFGATLGIDASYFGFTPAANDLDSMRTVSEIILLSDLLHRYLGRCEPERMSSFIRST